MAGILYVDFQATISPHTISYLKDGVFAAHSTENYDQISFFINSSGGELPFALEGNKFI